MTDPLRTPDVENAIERARAAARAIVEGRLTPIDGARAIEAAFADCYDAYQAGDELVDQLAVFAGRSDEWEELFDQIDRRKAIEDLIVQEAKSFLTSAGESP